MKKKPQQDRSKRALGRRLAKEVAYEELKRVTGAGTLTTDGDGSPCDCDEPMVRY